MKTKRVFVLATVAVAACEWPTKVCGCTPPYEDYTVSGTITLSSGSPLLGASIAASTTGTSCANVQPPYSFSPFGTATSASDGSFSITGRQFGDICMRLVVKRASAPDSVVQTIDFKAANRRQTVSIRYP
jgi:hypothetical protein